MPTYTPMPNPPLRSMSRKEFADASDLFCAAIVRLVNELNGFPSSPSTGTYLLDRSLSVGGQPYYTPTGYGIGMRVGSSGNNVSLQVLTSNPSTYGAGALYLSGNILTMTDGTSTNQKNGVGSASISLGDYGNGKIGFFADVGGTSGSSVASTQRATIEISPDLTFRPASNGTMKLGVAGAKWSEVFSSTGTINTSDSRLKTSITALTTSELNAAKRISKEIGVFKFFSSIEEKGDLARKHIGLTVQRAMEIMSEEGLTPRSYAFICYDKWEEQLEVGEPGKLGHVPYRPAGDVWGLRMDQLAFFLIAAITQTVFGE